MTNADIHLLAIPTTISVVSLLASIVTLFFTHLRAGKITSFVGPVINLGYPQEGGGIFMVVPITFTNHGARTSAVLKSGITLWRKDAPQERYFMGWENFVKQNFETNKWLNEEGAHAVAIQGKSIVAKTASFYWYTKSEPQVIFREGQYCFSFHYWTHKKYPSSKVHEVIITTQLLGLLNKVEVGSTRSIKLTVDETTKQNQFLNEFGYKKLIEAK